MRVLVTGGAGFIGSRLARECVSKGHEVRVVDSLLPQVHGPCPSPPDPDVEFQRADCRDLEAMTRAVRGVEVVVHLAALTGVGQSMYEAVGYTDVNCVGTSTVLQAALQEASVRRVVLSSSRAVYGEGAYTCKSLHSFTPRARSARQLAEGVWEHHCPTCGQDAQPLPTGEHSPLDTGSLYGATKEAQEQLVRSMCVPRDVEHVILRYFNVYGSGQSPNNPYTGILGVFARAGRSALPIPVYEDGLMLRDFIHVSDVVAATLLAIQNAGDTVNSTWNVGSGRPTSVLELAKTIAALQSAPEPVITGEYRVGDIRHCYADTNRTAAGLGFVPAMDLDRGLAEYLEWYATQVIETVPDASAELRSAGLAGESGSRRP